MSRLLRVLAIAAGFAVLLWGVLLWQRGRRQVPPPLTDMEVAQGWLECIDCQGPFLARLAALRGARQDTVVGFLRTALAAGPDSARRARHTRDLLRTWAADSAYAARHGNPVVGAHMPDAYIHRYQLGLTVKWKSRAAVALGVIRTSAALQALDSAAVPVPPTHADSVVQRYVEAARADSGRQALRHFP